MPSDVRNTAVPGTRGGLRRAMSGRKRSNGSVFSRTIAASRRRPTLQVVMSR